MTPTKLYLSFLELFPGMSNQVSRYEAVKNDKNSIRIHTRTGGKLIFTRGDGRWKLEHDKS